jgi:cytochrome P450
MAMRIEPSSDAPLSPPAPDDPYFSAGEQAWILSRHRDVLAATRSTGLSQARPPKAAPDPSVKPDREKSCFAEANGWIHSEVFTALVNSQTSKRQAEINALASALLEPLPRDRPVDLVAQFIRPWCLASAIALTGVDPADSERLAQLVRYLSESDAAPHDVELKSRAKQANKELDCFFLWPRASHAKSMFLGVAQTVPYFLASAWAALLQHPSEWNTLRANPDWIPKATEEFLRFAGPVHSVFRQAEREISICGTRIATGDRLILRLASANRDPQQFTDPDILDIKRGAAGHLALSSGSHYCVGASIVRMMTATATQGILARYSKAELSGPVEWSWGTMLGWASSLPVLLGSAV